MTRLGIRGQGPERSRDYRTSSARSKQPRPESSWLGRECAARGQVEWIPEVLPAASRFGSARGNTYQGAVIVSGRGKHHSQQDGTKQVRLWRGEFSYLRSVERRS